MSRLVHILCKALKLQNEQFYRLPHLIAPLSIIFETLHKVTMLHKEINLAFAERLFLFISGGAEAQKNLPLRNAKNGRTEPHPLDHKRNGNCLRG